MQIDRNRRDKKEDDFVFHRFDKIRFLFGCADQNERQGQGDDERVFPNEQKQMRRDESVENAAQSSADRQTQIKQGQLFGIGLFGG